MNNEVFAKVFDYAKAICINYSVVMNDDDAYVYRGKIYQQGLWLEMLAVLATVYAASSVKEVISCLQERIRMLEISYPVEALISGRIQANLRSIEILKTIKTEEKPPKVPPKYRKIVRF